jgi:hypothetical protein
MRVEEPPDRRVRLQAVGAFDQPVALVGVAQILHRHPAPPQHRHDLLRLAHRHARIVAAVDHEERRRDALHVVDRRDLLQERAVVLQAAILWLAQLAPPGAGVLEEGDPGNVGATA